MFIPIGLFPALLFRNATWKRSAIIGLGMSLFIEIAQYFIIPKIHAITDIELGVKAVEYFIRTGEFYPGIDWLHES